jgi:hypothetical protein
MEFGRMVRAVQLDRLLLLLVAPVLMAGLFLVPWPWLPLAAVAVGGVLFAWGRFALAAIESDDPRGTMRRVSKIIRASVRVPIVVFGHSHDPEFTDGADGLYVNTGTWSQHAGLQAFTHLVIERTGTGIRAALCQWTDGRSRPIQAPALITPS